MILIFQYFIRDEAVRRISEHSTDHPEQPLLLYVAFTAPHGPLQAPPELLDLVICTVQTGLKAAI